MDSNRLEYLVKTYLDDSATTAELSELETVLADEAWQAELESILGERYRDMPPSLITDRIGSDSYQRSMEFVLSHKQPVPARKLWARVAVAASLFIAVLAGGYFFSKHKYNVEQATAYQNDIDPGSNGATLTLSDGSKISVRGALAGKLAEQPGVKISKNAQGQLVYELSGKGGETGYNTLTTSRGEQSQVRLADGTLVFLNAESSLKYPADLKSSPKREVSLTGEGYFQVAKDKAHPFVVHTQGQQVEVVGTHFNISAYPERPAVQTTLEEGSVKVSGKVSGKTVLLKPGEQSSIKGTALEVKPVRVEDVVAWKDGSFTYDGETLERIMADVARWYNIEVIYRDPSVAKERFYVFVNRFDKVSVLLEVLERTHTLAFEIKGRQIIVNRKDN